MSLSKPTNLTAQQHAAIHSRDVSIALSAGAGCGKTFVLTQRFLSHLEPSATPCELSSLVAITFTERAAREMRDRIRGACRRRLRECLPEEVTYWQKIVRDVDSARITTIHSFCASLLRSHAVEARLDPRFALLDATTGGAFLRNAVRKALHALLSKQDANALELVYEYGLARTGELLESFVYQRFSGDFAGHLNRAPADLARFWEEKWRIEALPELLRQLIESPAANAVLAILREHTPSHATMRGRCEFVLRELPRLPVAEDPAAALDLLRENLKIQGGGGKGAWPNEEVYADVQEAFRQLRENQIDKLRDQLEIEPVNTLRAAELGLCALRAGHAVAAAYAEEKRAAGVLDFDDLLLGAQQLLREHPKVCDRVAAGISLLMVDEFQDTDPVQTEIVRKLCGAALSAGKLFLVGDAKQSIYRFRRAEPRIFHALRQEIPERGRLPLSVNFRSQPEILAFVNAVCDGALGPEYEPLSTHVTQESPKPVVEFLFACRGDDEPSSESPDLAASAAPPTQKESAGERRAREADWIARRLHALLRDGIARVRARDVKAGNSPLRPVEPGDIVILFRAMSDVRFYEEALRRHQLEYYVVGGRAFYAQQEIYDLVNLCRALDDVDDDVALAGVLRSPFFSLSDDALHAIASRPPTEASGENIRRSLTDALNLPPAAFLSESQQRQIRFAASVLTELRAQKDRLPIAGLLNLAIERTGYDAALLTEFLGARKLANLRKLLDMARQFDRSGFFSLSDFVDRLGESIADESKESLAPTHPESSNVIRLMSIHQAKGLEFPVVVVADMDRVEYDPTPSSVFDPELGPLVSLPDKFGTERKNLGLRLYRVREAPEGRAEGLRLLYVALTRAADHLILSAGIRAPGTAGGPWLRQVGERFDLLTGQPRTMPGTGGVSTIAKYSSTWPEVLVHRAPPPEPPRSHSSEIRRVPLLKLREVVSQTEGEPLPQTLDILRPDSNRRQQFSVSELETVDAGLRDAPVDSGGVSIAPTIAAPATEAPDAAPVEDADLLGTIIHAALEQWNFANPGDVSSLVARCSRTGTRHVADTILSAAAKWVSLFVNSKPAHELASAARLHRELEFLMRWPFDGDTSHHAQIAGTLDCLFQDDSGAWHLFDYKTGSGRAARDSARMLHHYEFQLGLYCLAIRQWTGAPPARADLIVIVDGQVRSISFQPSAAALNAIGQRLTQALAAIRQGEERAVFPMHGASW